MIDSLILLCLRIRNICIIYIFIWAWSIVTFSSVEHSGLGRYGDALNPWGDIIAIARAWCVTKQGGALLENTLHLYYLYIYMGLVVLCTLASPK
jgi:hypothetical protein